MVRHLVVTSFDSRTGEIILSPAKPTHVLNTGKVPATASNRKCLHTKYTGRSEIKNLVCPNDGVWPYGEVRCCAT
jgi:hypothetical protein